MRDDTSLPSVEQMKALCSPVVYPTCLPKERTQGRVKVSGHKMPQVPLPGQTYHLRRTEGEPCVFSVLKGHASRSRGAHEDGEGLLQTEGQPWVIPPTSLADLQSLGRRYMVLTLRPPEEIQAPSHPSVSPLLPSPSLPEAVASRQALGLQYFGDS